MSHANGKVFVQKQTVAIGVTNFEQFQSGQWVILSGQKRASRFVRERKTGNTYIVSAPRDGRVSNVGFRLACGVHTPKVVQEIK